MSAAPTSSGSRATSGASLHVLIGGAVIVLAVFFWVVFLYVARNRDRPGEQTGSPPPATQPTPAPVREIREIVLDSLFRFPPDGRLVKQLSGEFRIYPKGDSVWTIPPCGEPYWDVPGRDHTTRCSAGIWEWRRDPAKAVGVQVLFTVVQTY